MSWSSALSGVAVRPRVKRGVKYASTF